MRSKIFFLFFLLSDGLLKQKYLLIIIAYCMNFVWHKAFQNTVKFKSKYESIPYLITLFKILSYVKQNSLSVK